MKKKKSKQKQNKTKQKKKVFLIRKGVEIERIKSDFKLNFHFFFFETRFVIKM